MRLPAPNQKRRKTQLIIIINLNSLREAKNLKTLFNQEFANYYKLDKKNWSAELIKGDILE